MVTMRLTNYPSDHFLYVPKEETSMSKIVYDPESNSFVETEGWRSWGIVMLLVQYLATLIVIVYQTVGFMIVSVAIAIPIFLIVLSLLVLFGLK